jgi:predicted acetyltransferase
MAVEVRAIRADELEDWVRTTHVAFHVNRSAADEATYRRDVRKQDLSRSLAAFVDGELVGSYFSYPTKLSLPGPGACVAADAVTSVSVIPTHHRRGLLRRMMTADLQAARDNGEVASVLIAAEYPIYGRFGFGAAVEQAAYQLHTAHARFVREPLGSVELLAPERLREIAPDLFDRLRRDRPGQISRAAIYWDTRLGLKPSPWRDPNSRLYCALYRAPDNTPGGYLLYRTEGDWQHHVPTGRLEVEELIALDGDAYLALWRYCAEVDLVSRVDAEMRSTREPLAWLLYDARKAFQQTVRTDFLWVRPLDTPKYLAARHYAVEDQLVLQVDDPIDLAGGRFKLHASPQGATCQPTSESADLHLGISALSALSLGGVDPGVLATAGLVDEHTPGSLARAARLFTWSVTPWCSTFF